MRTYLKVQANIKNCGYDCKQEIATNLDNLKIGWRDKSTYTFVNDSYVFEAQSMYLDFAYFIQKKVNSGWVVKYFLLQNPSQYGLYINRALNITFFLNEDRFYERIKNNEIDNLEKEFIYTILSNEIDKNDNSSKINTEWKNSWIDETSEITSQPKNFNVKLFEYQLKSLNWASKIENSNYTSSFYSDCSLSLITEHSEISKLNFDMISKDFIFDIDNYKGHKQISNGGILADEMGLGKTITSIALICKNQKVIQPNLNLSDISINISNKKICSKATLIICPSHLTKQWELEVKKCNPKLKSLSILTKTNHQKYTYKDIVDCDIVIVSFQFLWNVSYYVNYHIINDLNSSNKITNSRMVETFSDRKKKINELFSCEDNDHIEDEVKKVFTFENVKWHRVIVDEAHEIFKATTYNYQEKYLYKFINSIESVNRWFVSGTPFWNTEGFNNIMDFLDFKIVKKFKIENDNYEIFLNYKDVLQHHISYSNIVKSIFRKFFIRNTKESVKHLLDIPNAISETVFLKFSDFEEKLYMSLKNGYNEDYLRQVCCNIQISDKFTNHEGSQILNFDEVKMKLLKDAQEKIIKTKSTINSLDTSVPGYAARLQMLKNIISSNEFLIKSFNVSEDTKVKESCCPICRCDFDDPVITQCGHNFCYECITSVLEIASYKKECPICRAQINNSKIYKLENNDQEEQPKDEIDELTYNYGTKIAKLIKLCNQILVNENNKIIIFSTWDKLLSMIGTVLKNNNIDNVFCKGNVHQRNSAIMSFRKEVKKKSKVRIIMLSTENAASGTNLTEATHIIFMEPIKGNINEIKSMEDQAIGRAVRLGQENQVHVYKLIIKDTIEEDIYNNKISNNNNTNLNLNNLEVDI